MNVGHLSSLILILYRSGQVATGVGRVNAAVPLIHQFTLANLRSIVKEGIDLGSLALYYANYHHGHNHKRDPVHPENHLIPYAGRHDFLYLALP